MIKAKVYGEEGGEYNICSVTIEEAWDGERTEINLLIQLRDIVMVTVDEMIKIGLDKQYILSALGRVLFITVTDLRKEHNVDALGNDRG